ncbi:MAG: RluA family pseudouridine synthase [Moraxellaceae bacterium]|nr:RluA family pseudouridine synthase [Moraxellaceae bacterium]
MTASDLATVRLLTIDEDRAGQRLDNFLITALKGAPRALVYRIVRKGEVRVNKGRVAPDYRLQAGDVVRVPPVRLSDVAPAPTPRHGLQKLLTERIVHDADHLLVVNKPAGLAVHGGSGVSVGLIEALRAMRPEQASSLELVHRLDRDTSGLIMVTSRRPLLRALHANLRDGDIDKRYVALLSGRLAGTKHRVEAPLLKVERPSGEAIVRVSREGKAAITEFTVLERFKDATLVEAKLLTGRTHQIRVHAQHLGHPLVGDDKYGLDAVNKQFQKKGLTRLFLHAKRLQLTLPDGKRLSLEADIDDDFEKGLAVLRRG